MLEAKPQIRRDINRPFNSAIVSIPDKSAFDLACEKLRYFVFEKVEDEATREKREFWARSLPYDNSLHGANAQRLSDLNVFIKLIPKDDAHNSKWLHEFGKQYGEIKSVKVSIAPDHSSRGYGFVTFQDPAAASKCLEENSQKD